MKNPILFDAAANALKFAFNFASTSITPLPDMDIQVLSCEDDDRYKTMITITGLSSDGTTTQLFDSYMASIKGTMDAIGMAYHIHKNRDKTIEINTVIEAKEIVAILNEEIPSYAKQRATNAAKITLG